MTRWEFLIDHLLLLSAGIPCCGILTIGFVTWMGREALNRTLLLNGLLTFGCALAVLFSFETGSERTRLSPAESFQLGYTVAETVHSDGFRFGVDGSTLPLVLFVSALPLLSLCGRKRAGQSGFTSGEAVLLLFFQVLLLIFLTSLDRRVQLVSLLLSTLVLFLALAVSVPAGRRTTLNRWQRQRVLSDFLIAGGLLATLLPLARVTEVDTTPDDLFDLPSLLTVVETTREDELPEYLRLVSSVRLPVILTFLGCSIRFGAFPFSRTNRETWEQVSPFPGLLIWIHGPILATAVILREFLIFPQAGYQVAGYFQYVWVIGLLISAAMARLADGPQREAGTLVYFGSFTLISICGPNEISLAGTFLLLMGIGLRIAGFSGRPSSGGFLTLVARFLLAAGVICALVGHWQGPGAGSRSLGMVLFIGLTLLIIGRGRRSRTASRLTTHSRLLPHFDRQNVEAKGEQIIWNVSEVEKPQTVESPLVVSGRAAAGILAVCLLLMFPQFLWNRIRWDLQKLDFPEGESQLSVREETR